MKRILLGLIFCSLIVATASALPKNVTTWTPSHSIWPNWYTNGSPVPKYTCVTNFYVSSGNLSGPAGNDGNTGTLASPYATINAAWNAHAGAGVCINVVGPNNNNVAGNLALGTGGNSNAPTGWAVLRAVDVNGVYNPVRDQAQNFHVGVAPRIYAGSNVFTEIELNTAYIIVDGFEVDFSGATNPGGGGGGCGFVTNGTSGAAHHLVVENNLVHDAGFTGIQLNNSEYIWIYNNGVHDNASVNGAEGSGISVWEPHTATAFTATGLDTALPFHILTINNIIWHNFESPVIAAAQHTDGDAIIMDTFTAANGNPVNYVYPALVYGNVACYNGGGAAQMTSAQFVTVAHNSSYANYIDLENGGTWRGEGNIWNADSTGNKYFNNSFYTATSGAGINSGAGSLANNVALNFHPTGQAGNTVGTNIVWPNAPFNESTSQFSGTGNGFPAGQLLMNPNYRSIGTLPVSSTNVPPCDLHPTAVQTIGAQTVTSTWWRPTIGAYQYGTPRAVVNVNPIVAVPANLLAGSISGTSQVGQTLTATTGTWSNSPTSFVYTWMRGTVVDQTGASATYIPVQADTGSPIKVSVVATNNIGGSASAGVSPATAVVAAAPFAAVVNPVTVDGTTFAKTSAGIQSAINACTGSCNGVSLAAGTFTITGVIAPKSNVAIFGQGKGVTILQGGVPFGATFLYNSATNLTNVRISDMTIDTQFVSKSSGIQLSNISNSTISKMAFTNGDVDGWQLYIGANGDMTSNGVQNFNNLIDRIDFTNHAGTLESFLIFNSQFATISNITLTNATGPGIGLWQKDYDSQLTAITCTNSAETNGLIYYSVTVERTVIADLHTTNCGPAIKGANISDWGTFGLNHADNMMVSDAVIVGGANSTNFVGLQIGGINNMRLVNAQISGYQIGVQLFDGNGNNVIAPGTLDSPTNWQIIGGTIKNNNGTNNFNDLHPGVLFNGKGGVENGLMNGVQIFDDQVTHTQTNPISFEGNVAFSNIAIKANSLAAGTGISSLVFGGGASLGGTSSIMCNTNYTGTAPSQAACTAPVNTVLPVISGTAQVGQVLTATTGTWTNSPTSFAYTWKRTTGNVTDKVDASPAYSPVAADVGSTITVSVVATNASGPSASVVSAATASISP